MSVMNEDTAKAIKRAMAADLNLDLDELSIEDGHEGLSRYGFGFQVRGPGHSEWLVFETEEAAYDEAVRVVEEDLKNEPEIFNRWLLEQHIYVTEVDRSLIASDEANFIISDMDIEELMDRYALDDLQEEYDELLDQWMEDQISESEYQDRLSRIQLRVEEKVHDIVYEETYKALEDPIEFFIEDRGQYSSVGELMDAGLVRINEWEAAKEAVGTDGPAHFLDRWDSDVDEVTDPETNQTFYVYQLN